MLTAVVLNILVTLGQLVSLPLGAIPLPSWMDDSTIPGAFGTLHNYIYGSPAPRFFDLPFIFGAAYFWWGVRIALIPVRWLLGAARRIPIIGGAIPTIESSGPTIEQRAEAAADRIEANTRARQIVTDRTAARLEANR